MIALLLYPTHANCDEVCLKFQETYIDAKTYAPRLTKSTKHHRQNCWNEEADAAEKIGLPVATTVCLGCKERKRCEAGGYLGNLAEARAATVAIATHTRAEMTSLQDLVEHRQYVSIHEDPLRLLRPSFQISYHDLEQAQKVLNFTLNHPYQLDWFADHEVRDENGEWVTDTQRKERREKIYDACCMLAELVDQLLLSMQQAERTVRWSSGIVFKIPPGLTRTLFYCSNASKADFHDQPWRFLLAAAERRLETITIVDPIRPAGPRTPEELAKRVAYGHAFNPPPDHAVVWFNDATLTREDLENVLRRPVTDLTPDGKVRRQKKAVQIPRDITRQTSHRIFVNLVQGILADRPQFQRVGLITHRPLLSALEQLESAFRNRIVRHSYFGSGEDRSSNTWQQECDLMLIVGTPRVPTIEVIQQLLQTRQDDAARQIPEWGPVRWDGRTESGQAIRVNGRGYYDPIWRQAHQSLVRANLVQAIGRGRGILESGCEVVVVTTEECGLPISDAACVPLNEHEAALLAQINQRTMDFSISSIKENSIVQTDELSRAVNLSLVRTRELLRSLERRGLIRKIGARGGWTAVAPLGSDSAPTPEASSAAPACSPGDVAVAAPADVSPAEAADATSDSAPDERFPPAPQSPP